MNNYEASLQKHMTMLCESIGARPTGSAENRAAADYAFEVLQSYGFDVRRQEFTCIDWHSSGAALRVDGQNVLAEPAEYAMPCDVQATFVCLDSVDALQKAELAGNIAVLHGDLCKEPLMPKNFEFWNPDEHKRIIALLEEKAPEAIITVSSQHEHIIQDGDFGIPCAVVSENMLDAFLKSVNRTAKLTISTERIPAMAHNVTATYGAGRDKVIISAHIDTKPKTPGALDNASGVAVLLALAEAIVGKAPPVQVEIVLFNGEDYYSNPGEITYMRGLKPGYRMAVNVDGVGLKGSTTSVSLYECETQFENRIIECADRAGGMERIEPWPMGDHMIFANHGIPTIAITASSIFGLLDTVIHSPDDDMKNIDLHTLDNVVRFLLSCIE